MPNDDVSSTISLVLIAITTLVACATLGGGLYEFLVVDPAWPKRPGIIQPRNGGVSRARFWVPVHTVFEVFNEVQDAVNSFFPDRQIKHFDILSFVKGQEDG